MTSSRGDEVTSKATKTSQSVSSSDTRDPVHHDDELVAPWKMRSTRASAMGTEPGEAAKTSEAGTSISQGVSSLDARDSVLHDDIHISPGKIHTTRPRSMVAEPVEAAGSSEARPVSWSGQLAATWTDDSPFTGSEIQPTPERRVSTTSQTQRTVDLSVSLRKQLRQVQKLANQAVTGLFDLEYQQDTLDNCRRFLEQSTGECLNMVGSLMSTPPDQWNSLRKGFERRMKNDHIAFRAQSGRLAVARTQLKDLQDRLKGRAEKLSKSLESVNLDIPAISGSLLDAMESQSDLSSADGHDTDVSDTPSLLSRFHNCKGDLFVHYERVTDLEAKYREDVQQRDFIKDRGDEVEIPDDVFEADYHEQRRKLANQIVALQREVDRLSEDCVKAGYDIAEAYSSEEVDSNEEDPTDHSKVFNTDHIRGFSIARKNSILRDLPDYVPNRNRHFVRGWLDGLKSLSLSDPGTGTPHFSDTISTTGDRPSPAAGVQQGDLSQPPAPRAESRRQSFRNTKTFAPLSSIQGPQTELQNTTQSARPRSRRSVSDPEATSSIKEDIIE